VAVLNKHRLPGKAIPEGAVYIGRGGPWGNPFIIGKDGSRAEVIAKYRACLWHHINDDKAFMREVAALHGKDLVCFCKPAPCHGDVLEVAAAWAAAKLDLEK